MRTGGYAGLTIERGVPQFIHSDNGPDIVAKKPRQWLGRVGAKSLYITPGSPRENGYCGSFKGKLRNELPDGEIFDTLREAQVLIEQSRQHYKRIRPPSAQRLARAGTGDDCGSLDG
jgi:putative transposase